MKDGCVYMIPRSPRHPVADLRCNVASRFVVYDVNSPINGARLCGVHANCVKRRGYLVVALGEGK